MNKQTNKNLRCGNRKGLLGRNDQTHHRMGPKTMDATPPIKRNTQAYIQLPRLQTVRRKQIRHQEDRDGSKANTMQSTNQARCPVSPPHLYHPKCPEHHPRLIPKHISMTELILQVGYGAYLNLLAFQKYHMRDLDYGMPAI